MVGTGLEGVLWLKSSSFGMRQAECLQEDSVRVAGHSSSVRSTVSIQHVTSRLYRWRVLGLVTKL